MTLYRIINRTTTSPPGSPAVQDTYLVGTGASGDWSGHDGEIAMATTTSGGWVFAPLVEGDLAWDLGANEEVFYDGASLATRGDATGPILKSGLNAKGDLIVATADNTPARLAVGTDGHVLTADSAQATGVKWAAAAGGGDALVADGLDQFASTTSAELAGVISDETGTGALVFADSPLFAGTPTFPNTGLHILDTNASHDLIVAPGSNLTADRTLTITTGDADRTLDISAGSVTVSAAGAALIDDADASAQRTTLGLGTMATATATDYVAKSLVTTKGDVIAATASATPTRVAVGGDGTALQAFAGASPGVRWAGAPMAVQFGRTAVGSGASGLAMGFANGTDSCFVVPSGWIFACVAATAFSPATTANVPTLVLRVDDVDVSGSWGTLSLPASTTDAKDSAEPTSPPYVVDASGGEKRIDFAVSTTAAGGGNANIAAILFGYLYKAT